jgi:uncharacterized protein YjiS (DUF1127 family)
MANVITLDHYSRPAADAGLIGRLRKAYADFRSFVATSAELEALSDRELADLGISRLSVRDIAREAVYGK